MGELLAGILLVHLHLGDRRYHLSEDELNIVLVVLKQSAENVRWETRSLDDQLSDLLAKLFLFQREVD